MPFAGIEHKQAQRTQQADHRVNAAFNIDVERLYDAARARVDEVVAVVDFTLCADRPGCDVFVIRACQIEQVLRLFGRAFTLGGGEMTGVNQELEKQNALIATTKTDIQEYNTALEQNKTAVNDAAAAQKSWEDTELAYVKSNIQLGQTTDALKAADSDILARCAKKFGCAWYLRVIPADWKKRVMSWEGLGEYLAMVQTSWENANADLLKAQATLADSSPEMKETRVS